MEVPERLKVLSEQIQEVCKAEQFYVVDIDEQPTDDVVGTVVFGMRNAGVPVLYARQQAGKMLQEATNQPVAVEVFSDPFEEVEYLFDRYLRAYIASHGGIVTPTRIEESSGELWIHMDGGCSGCPASLATLKHGIERTLKKHLPWVRKVEAINEAEEPEFGINLDLSAGLPVLPARPVGG